MHAHTHGIMALLCTLVPMKDGFLFGASLPPLYGFLAVPITHNMAMQTILHAFICLLKTRHPKRAFCAALQTKNQWHWGLPMPGSCVGRVLSVCFMLTLIGRHIPMFLPALIVIIGGEKVGKPAAECMDHNCTSAHLPSHQPKRPAEMSVSCACLMSSFSACVGTTKRHPT